MPPRRGNPKVGFPQERNAVLVGGLRQCALAQAQAKEEVAHRLRRVRLLAARRLDPTGKARRCASRLLEQIGEGGMGTVWMAEQREPVKRRVALKIIKLGMDTKQVIARFEAERQALAHDGSPAHREGARRRRDRDGPPVLRDGVHQGHPDPRVLRPGARRHEAQRLELFASVCHAIQHAHQKGIIHRDIKPSNVLVTLHDGVPVPKVIDFGIAKATNSELTRRRCSRSTGR
jgi:serine/threonine protein kinase